MVFGVSWTEWTVRITGSSQSLEVGGFVVGVGG